MPDPALKPQGTPLCVLRLGVGGRFTISRKEMLHGREREVFWTKMSDYKPSGLSMHDYSKDILGST